MKYIEERKTHGPIPPGHWLLHICTFPYPRDYEQGLDRRVSDLDPQRGWYALNRNIERFLEKVPQERWLRVRGEDVLADPHTSLPVVCRWLGVSDDAAAVEEMAHPERSAYARFGPPAARYGNDAFFLQSPALRPARAQPKPLDGPLPWRDDGCGLLPEVRELARRLGYE
jgi:hypothetical protein